MIAYESLAFVHVLTLCVKQYVCGIAHNSERGLPVGRSVDVGERRHIIEWVSDADEGEVMDVRMAFVPPPVGRNMCCSLKLSCAREDRFSAVVANVNSDLCGMSIARLV